MVLVVVVIEFRRQEAAPRSVGSGFGFDLPRAAPLSATAGRASFGGPHALALLPLGPPSSAAARSPVARVLARAAPRSPEVRGTVPLFAWGKKRNRVYTENDSGANESVGGTASVQRAMIRRAGGEGGGFVDTRSNRPLCLRNEDSCRHPITESSTFDTRGNRIQV